MLNDIKPAICWGLQLLLDCNYIVIGKNSACLRIIDHVSNNMRLLAYQACSSDDMAAEAHVTGCGQFRIMAENGVITSLTRQ